MGGVGRVKNYVAKPAKPVLQWIAAELTTVRWPAADWQQWFLQGLPHVDNVCWWFLVCMLDLLDIVTAHVGMEP